MDALTIAGLCGAAIVLLAYFCNQLDRLNAADWRFPLLNLIGALLILLSLTEQWNLPAATIEGAWAAVSAFGLLKRLLR
jgi:hypothetical protein